MLHSNLDDNASSTLASHCICRPLRARSCGTGPPVRDLPKHNPSVCLFHKFQLKSIPNRHRRQTSIQDSPPDLPFAVIARCTFRIRLPSSTISFLALSTPETQRKGERLPMPTTAGWGLINSLKPMWAMELVRKATSASSFAYGTARETWSTCISEFDCGRLAFGGGLSAS